eukprot:CAMPEP_0202858514 /NCGR_PEP_ID=MMETSP1391-20130828/1015_1 /ASSEMBLY_ACC=CAM_ASM_000867 /TAXON_ID=1034604 /ORGANISM="Chlamydomonas leiostraca, Strain SAG 11-49" /LENGTH=56 /DNA_ID=CAMNT_0049537439 /DNA_START=146 /DNA_END=316 /DNA_ORIENTATION=+
MAPPCLSHHATIATMPQRCSLTNDLCLVAAPLQPSPAAHSTAPATSRRGGCAVVGA